MKFTGERVVPEDMIQGENSMKTYNKVYTHLEHLRRYIFAQKYCKGKTIIDAACGCGYGTEMLGELAEHSTGFDVSIEAIEYAKEKHPKSEFHLKNLEMGLNFENVDVIVSFETIEHLKNPAKFLDDCANSCDTFIFSLPLNNKSNFHKQVYTLDTAQALIKKYFVDWEIDWYEQKLDVIKPLTAEGRFLIGVSQRKENK